MFNQFTLKRHAELVDRMAEAVGVDLEEAVLRAEIDIDDISEAVLACTGCADPDGCGQWLERNGTGAAAAPSFCRNRALFETLVNSVPA